MKRLFHVLFLLCFFVQSFASITLSIAGVPVPFYEWMLANITITVTVTSPTSNVTNATLKLTLKYHTGLGNEIIVRQYVKTGLGFPSPSNLTVNFNIQAAYACSDNVQLVAELTSGAGNATTSVGLSISQAVAIYTGGPYGSYLGGDSRNACRWTEEPITIRVCAGVPADESDFPNHIISNYGCSLDTNNVITNAGLYNLSSSDGISFSDTNGNPVTAVQFINGAANFQISLSQPSAAAVFRLSNRSYPEDVKTSSNITVQDPLFEWLNITNQTAYGLYTRAKVIVTNNISPVPFHNFPLANFLLSVNPSGALTASHTGFAGSGSSYTDSLVLNSGGVNSNVSVSLTYFGDAAPLSASPLFNINPVVPAPPNSHLVSRQVRIDNLDAFPELAFVGRVLGPAADYPFIVSNNTVIDKGDRTNRFFLYAVSNTTLAAKGGLEYLTYDLTNINIIDPGPYYITDASALTNDSIIYHVLGYSNRNIIMKVKTRTLTFTDGIPPVIKNY